MLPGARLLKGGAGNNAAVPRGSGAAPPEARFTFELVMHGLVDALGDAGQPVLEGQGDLRLVQQLVTAWETKKEKEIRVPIVTHA